MEYKIIPTPNFIKDLKILKKKYLSISNDIEPFLEQLRTHPTLGNSLGKNLYKIRIPISSKNKGKSAGARLITFVQVIENSIYLITIFDKSDKSNISDNELKKLINLL